MKKSLLALAFVFSCFFVFSQKKKNLTHLSGTITNPNSNMVYLRNAMSPESLKYIDSARLDENGFFQMSFKVDLPIIAVFTDGLETSTMIISNGDNISLSLNTLYFDETLKFTGKGSDKNNAIISLYVINEVNNNELSSLMLRPNVDTAKLFKIHQNNHQKYIDLIDDYVAKIPDFSFYGNVLKMMEAESTKGIKKDLLDKIELINHMEKLSTQPAIDFKGVNILGDSTRLSDYKGKITVVDFWATWCGPCKAEFPAYKALEKKYGDRINFVSVALWCEEDEWRKMAKKEGFKNNIFISRELEA